jgi:hypothetical protein
MAVITYSLKKDGKTKLSTNFTVKEFACKDGSDVVLIDTDLVNVLQKIRTKFKAKVTINSAYRTEAYNKKIGGSSSSYHVKGMAADIAVSGIDPIKVAIYAATILGSSGGIELGSYGENKDGYIHIDVRGSKWRSIRPNSNSFRYTSYSDLMPTVKYGTGGDVTTVLTRKLKKLGYLTTTYSNCNGIVYNAIKSFQSSHNLTADGVFGTKSWSALAEVI